MIDARLEELGLLRSIDATLKELLLLSKSKRAAAPTPKAWDEKDLDSPHGDEIINSKMPRDWSGPDFKGSHMSQCPPELLDMLAERSAYFAQKNDESQAKTDAGVLKSTYDRRSEKRARGWAARLRSGWKPAAPAADDSNFASDSEIRW